MGADLEARDLDLLAVASLLALTRTRSPNTPTTVYMASQSQEQLNEHASAVITSHTSEPRRTSGNVAATLCLRCHHRLRPLHHPSPSSP